MIGLLLLAAQAAAPDALPPAPPITVSRPSHTPGDPLEGFNRSVYRFNDRLDRAILRPAAMGYQQAVPRFVRTGLRNAFSNLTEPVVFLNFLLQLKIGKAAETAVRFAANSTLGLGGTIDVASKGEKNLPHRPNGFGDTLGFYGVKPGPYLYLPVFGPSTLRDFAGGQADALVLPLAVGHPFDQLKFQLPRGVISGLDLRAEHDGDLKALLGTALDPYATLRSAYLQNRAGEIADLKGKPLDEEDAGPADPLTDPAPPAAAAPQGGAAQLQDPLADPAAAPAPPKQ